MQLYYRKFIMPQEILGLVDAGTAATAAAGGSSASLILLIKREFTEIMQRRAKKEAQDELVAVIKRELVDSAKDLVELKQTTYEMRNLVKALYKWHDKEDAEGRKIWYTSASTNKAVEDLATVLNQQTQIFNVLTDKMIQHESTINSILSHLRKD